ncbi:hypothetical protein O6H91_24G000500 [Diphasiastrum complanatum]|uniref:Uncharacterized protein n=1 Tax=Diphasiastrum complanatum TaxID=34168 RepID=A0ACC2A735_DIPCM|nr:hypothetical protein O6H91_24G000500 [Diphasiastrum complanatum]
MPINCNHEIFSAYMQISSLSLSITSTSAAAASAASSSSSSSLKLAFACKRALLLHQLRNPSHFLNQCYFSLLPTNRLASSRRICSHMNNKLSSASSHEEEAETEMGSDMKVLPVLLFDVMGTIVRDPFYEDVPAFFGLSMKELLAIKHPTAWIEFEKGHLAEDQLKEIFFNDGRGFDFSGLKDLMLNGYQYLEGMEELLSRLKVSGYQMHAFTNYPSWYNMVEDKLKLSQYLSWTFVSCHTGLRKPDAQAYIAATQHLKLQPSDCVFIDDRRRNVETALQLGMSGFLFRTAGQLEQDLYAVGLKL